MDLIIICLLATAIILGVLILIDFDKNFMKTVKSWLESETKKNLAWESYLGKYGTAKEIYINLCDIIKINNPNLDPWSLIQFVEVGEQKILYAYEQSEVVWNTVTNQLRSRIYEHYKKKIRAVAHDGYLTVQFI